MERENEVKEKIFNLKKMILGKQRLNTDQTPLNMLFDIESELENYFRFFSICKEADEKSVKQIVDGIKKEIRKSRHEANAAEEIRKQVLDQEKRKSNQNKQRVVLGVKKIQHRSIKQEIKFKTEKKSNLTDEQIEMRKFLGGEFMDALLE